MGNYNAGRKRILIIGNGFDLYHNLKTSYRDFLIDCESKSSEDNFNESIKGNIWINLKNKLDKNWSGFERDIANVIKLVEDIHEDAENIAPNIRKKITNITGADLLEADYTYREFHEKSLNDLEALKEVLSNYLCEVCRNLVDFESEYWRDFDHILTFNYTDIYQREFIGEDICYIHGSIMQETRMGDLQKKGQHSIILGMEDNMENENENITYIDFKKTYQRIHQKTDSKYLKWIKEAENSDGCDVFIFGHSLDVVDKDVLKQFIEIPNSKITIYYHDQKNYGQLIRNLIVLIGKNKVFERISVENPSIEFLEQTPVNMNRLQSGKIT